MDIATAGETAERIVAELEKVITGQNRAVEEMVISLIAGGHSLIEGVPGTGKTLMARALAEVTGLSFKRIQFTPDLMPADVVGVNIYNTAKGEFTFRQGPVFADIILADEINRAPAKTQSALLEAMQEKQATVDGKSYEMSRAFSVFATQNPVEFEGTYPLPEAELDRFMFKIFVPYPEEPMEQKILDRVQEGFRDTDLKTAGIQRILDLNSLLELREAVSSLHIEPNVRRYITSIIRATRNMTQISLGASPRAGIMLLMAAKGRAAISRREFVTPDDVKSAALPVLRHRILLHPEIEVEGRTPDDCIKDLLTSMEVPR